MHPEQCWLTPMARAISSLCLALIAPSAPGFAPHGRTPGNPLFNALWTALQLPVMNLPVPGLDMPLGLSLIVRRAFDRQLPALATRLAAAL